MIDPLRYSKEQLPPYELARPVFCVSCLSQRHTRSNPNVAVVFCHECSSSFTGEKEYGVLLCRVCEQEKHRSGQTRNHARQIVVYGPGVRKKVLVRGDGVTFPQPLDHVTLCVRAKIYNNGVKVGVEPWQTLRFVTGLSGKCLHIQVLGARDLRGTDITGYPDAEVVYSFCGKPLGSTRVRPRSKNPRWHNETFVVPVEDALFTSSAAMMRNTHREMLASQRDLVKLEVFDHDWVAHSRLIGQVEMHKSKLMKLAVVANEQPIRVPLNFREHHGLLHIQLGLTQHELVVRVVCAEDLDKKSFGQYNDVYVKLFCGESRLLGVTAVVENAVNPVWAAENEFRLSLAEALQIEAQLETQIALYRQTLGLQQEQQQENEPGELQKNAERERNEENADADEGESERAKMDRQGERALREDESDRESVIESESMKQKQSERDNLAQRVLAESEQDEENEEQAKERDRQTRERDRERRRAGAQRLAGLADALADLDEFEALPEFLAFIRAEVFDRSRSFVSQDKPLGTAVVPLRVLRKALPELPPPEDRELLEEQEKEREEDAVENSLFGRARQLARSVSQSLTRSLSRSLRRPMRLEDDEKDYEDGEEDGTMRIQEERLEEGETHEDQESEDSEKQEEGEREREKEREQGEKESGSESEEEDEERGPRGESERDDERGGERENEKKSSAWSLPQWALSLSASLLQFLSLANTRREKEGDEDKHDREDEENEERESEEEEEDEDQEGEDESDNEKRECHAEGEMEKVRETEREGETERDDDVASRSEDVTPRNDDLSALPPLLARALSQISTPTASQRLSGRLSSRAASLPLVLWSDTLRLPITRNTTAGGTRAKDEDDNAHGALVLRLLIGSRGVVCTGIDAAAQRMTLGESSVVKVRFDELYGSFGVSSRLPPRANALVKMRLLQVENKGLAGLPVRFARRLFRTAWLVVSLLWHALLVLLKLRRDDVLRHGKHGGGAWGRVLRSLGFVKHERNTRSDGGGGGSGSERDSDSDEDSIDSEEERAEEERQRATEEAFAEEQRRLEEEERQRVEEERERARAGRVDKHIRKHLTPAARQGVRLMWGVTVADPAQRKRPNDAPPPPPSLSAPPAMVTRSGADTAGDEKRPPRRVRDSDDAPRFAP